MLCQYRGSRVSGLGSQVRVWVSKWGLGFEMRVWVSASATLVPHHTHTHTHTHIHTHIHTSVIFFCRLSFWPPGSTIAQAQYRAPPSSLTEPSSAHCTAVVGQYNTLRYASTGHRTANSRAVQKDSLGEYQAPHSGCIRYASTGHRTVSVAAYAMPVPDIA
eukprot:1247121-Rhodomonas_salina.1